MSQLSRRQVLMDKLTSDLNLLLLHHEYAGVFGTLIGDVDCLWSMPVMTAHL